MFVFRALASGSSGNAFVLRTEKVSLLFEAGLRLATLRKHLASEHLTPDMLDAVFVSHEHRDHCACAGELAELFATPIVANEEVLKACGLHGSPSAESLSVGKPRLFGDVEVTSFPISHDAVRPVGFHVRTHGRSFSIATDTGHATPEMLEAISDSDLIVLESNHDVDMLHAGRYPYHLRRRVAGPTGHLSNAQAAGILTKTIKRHDVQIWLAHLSKENNTHALALKTARAALKAAGLRLPVDIALRDRPSVRWTGQPRPQQLSLFGPEELP